MSKVLKRLKYDQHIPSSSQELPYLYNYSLLYTVQCTFYIVLVGNGPLSGRRREIIFVPKKVINTLAVYRLYLGGLWFARPRTL